jgi:hypothetical protein
MSVTQRIDLAKAARFADDVALFYARIVAGQFDEQAFEGLRLVYKDVDIFGILREIGKLRKYRPFERGFNRQYSRVEKKAARFQEFCQKQLAGEGDVNGV